MNEQIDPKDKMALRVLDMDTTHIPQFVEITEVSNGCHFSLRTQIATGQETRIGNRKIYPSMAGSVIVVLTVSDPSVRIPLSEEDIVIRIEQPGVYLLEYGSRYRNGIPDGWEAMFNKLLDYLERLAKVCKDD